MINTQLYTGGVMYHNVHAFHLPGCLLLPHYLSSRLLITITKLTVPVIIEWEHEHSGWRVVLEVLWDYLKWSEVPQGSMHACASAVHSAEITLMLDDVGMEAAEDEELSTDALDPMQTIIYGKSELMTELMSGLEHEGLGALHTPDFIELSTCILEDALLQSMYTKGPPPIFLITSAVGILMALLHYPYMPTEYGHSSSQPHSSLGLTTTVDFFKFKLLLIVCQGRALCQTLHTLL